MSARAVARLETLGFRQVYRYTAGKADWLAADLPAEGERTKLTNPGMLARRDVARAEITEKIAEIRDRAKSAGWDCAVAVNEESVVLGFLDSTALLSDPAAIAEQVMDPGPLTMRPNLAESGMESGSSKNRPNIALEMIANRMRAENRDNAIISDQDGHLIGLLLRKEVEQNLSST
jgi:hypothetical protein